MKASELKPGQFFECDGKRYLYMGIDDCSPYFQNWAYKHDGKIVNGYSPVDFDVTPLNVHGWDDEPSDKANEDFIAERFVDIAIKSQKKLDGCRESHS